MYLPFLGMFLFLVFYILAAANYPGGSWQEFDSEGFSLINNYLCDLLDEYAINGELNRGRYFARFALGALCLSILQIWMVLPGIFDRDGFNIGLMRISGVLALITVCFLSSEQHDTIVYLAGILGSVAFICCFMELYRNGYTMLLFLGIFCFALFLLNYYMYESRQFVELLPLMQKVTMLLIICWFSMLNFKIIRAFKSQ